MKRISYRKLAHAGRHVQSGCLLINAFAKINGLSGVSEATTISLKLLVYTFKSLGWKDTMIARCMKNKT